MSFTVAIVGRPNVGKSTLFNRLAGRKLALVDDTPGVTRDRRPGDARLVDLKFRIIDTAGLEESGPDTLEGRMRAQTEAAIDEADLSLFLIDAKLGLTPADETLANILRKRGKAGRRCRQQGRGAWLGGESVRCLPPGIGRTLSGFRRTWRGHAGPARRDRRSAWRGQGLP